MTMHLTKTPEPPYYAVIFTNLLNETDDGYSNMGDAMFDLAHQQAGFLGADSTRGQDRLGITVSYWKDEASIQSWKANAKHMVAQSKGIEHWYTHYELRVAKIERAYSGPEGRHVK